MSTKKKPKKFRTPNVPLMAGMTPEAPASVMHTSAEPRAQFDYTHVKHDLRRIGILAGSILAVMVALSFFIN